MFPLGFVANRETYNVNCLPKVVAYIKKYHADSGMVFWQDLASIHYAKRLSAEDKSCTEHDETVLGYLCERFKTQCRPSMLLSKSIVS